MPFRLPSRRVREGTAEGPNAPSAPPLGRFKLTHYQQALQAAARRVRHPQCTDADRVEVVSVGVSPSASPASSWCLAL